MPTAINKKLSVTLFQRLCKIYTLKIFYITEILNKMYSIKKILPFSFHLIPQFAIHLQDLKEKGKKSTQALFRENERLIKAKGIVSRALLHFQFLTWKTQH